MNLNNLISVKSSDSKRVGRGIGSQKGKTAGRGTKGQKSRSGGNTRVGFEGGQMPLIKRVPKLKGFKSRRPRNQAVNLQDLNFFTGNVTKEKLLEKGLIEDIKLPVKILGNGTLGKALEVSVEAVSKSAEKEITKKGGKVNILTVRQAAKKQKKEATKED